jgi:hypothetical protein
MKQITRITLLFIIALILNGCAIGNKHAYHDIAIDFKGKKLPKLAIATLDARSYILNETKKPDFVGLQRSSYGIPFKIKTVSGNPLAEDMTHALVQSLKQYKVGAIPVVLQHNTSIETAHSNLSKKGTNRSLLLVLREWKSDSLKRPVLSYDIALSVLNKTGKVIAKKSMKGNQIFSRSLFTFPNKQAKKTLPLAFKEKMELLLNDKNILIALQ